jgi:hypothetical protein
VCGVGSVTSVRDGVRIFPYVEEAFDVKDKHPLSIRVQEGVNSGTVGQVKRATIQARARMNEAPVSGVVKTLSKYKHSISEKADGAVCSSAGKVTRTSQPYHAQSARRTGASRRFPCDPCVDNVLCALSP